MRRLVLVAILLTGLAAPARADVSFSTAEMSYCFGDFSVALPEFRALAKQDDGDAQTMLGHMYSFGQGVPQDYAEAARWYRKAAEGSSAEAQFDLGQMYRFGRGVPQDYAEAVKWLRKAAEQDSHTAQSVLSSMYSGGWGISKNEAEAAKWLRKASENELSRFVAVDRFTKDAAAGRLHSSYRASVWEFDHCTKYVTRWDNRVFWGRLGWVREMAERGCSPIAQINLGQMYRFGRGVPQDYVLAHMWLNLAGSRSGLEVLARWQQIIAEMSRDLVAARMTPDQIAEAQRMAREWLAQHEKGASEQPCLSGPR